MTKFTSLICGIIGAVGSAIAQSLGGWDASIITLVTFMGIDYLTGLICAAVFHKSVKSADGKLESRASFKGLCRKGMILLLVLVGARLDLLIGANYIRDGICIAFIANETISITENAIIMGIPVPDLIMQAIGMLKRKGDDKND